MEKNMKKKTMTLILIAVAITVALVCIAGVIIKSPEPPPITSPSVTPTPSAAVPPEMDKRIEPKFEDVEIKLNESVLVKGNLIKLISIEEEKGIVKIEVQNETTGEPMVVPFDFVKGGLSFKYKNILIFPVKVEDNRVTFVIAEM
ncbi:hypothetical protein C5S30_04015 [ANME-1 cluster archaeon GoMg4]|nr:hypothetical protein [ANME-1 cluster archaeon GoMg4]